jgi:hypothetical protein
MFRKFAIALGATAVLGAAALTPTAASAKHWHHPWRHVGVVIASQAYAASDCYLVERVFWRHHVKHVRFVEVCD